MTAKGLKRWGPSSRNTTSLSSVLGESRRDQLHWNHAGGLAFTFPFGADREGNIVAQYEEGPDKEASEHTEIPETQIRKFRNSAVSIESSPKP
jgi:hypothetical protein